MSILRTAAVPAEPHQQHPRLFQVDVLQLVLPWPGNKQPISARFMPAFAEWFTYCGNFNCNGVGALYFTLECDVLSLHVYFSFSPNGFPIRCRGSQPLKWKLTSSMGATMGNLTVGHLHMSFYESPPLLTPHRSLDFQLCCCGLHK